jgi:hypothetical protein
MSDIDKPKVKRTEKRVTSLTSEEAANLDAYARNHYMSAAAVIRQAVLAHIGTSLPCPWFPVTPEEHAAAARLKAAP